MKIRRAEDKDISQIKELLRQVCLIHHNGRPDLFKDGDGKYTDKQLIQMIKDDKKPIFVAVDDEKVLGYVFCVFKQYIDNNILTDIKTLYIDDLCVDENIRGKHIGKLLYNYSVDFAKKSGCYNLTLNVWSCNVSAMKFYESCGLKPQKINMEVIID